MRLLLFSCALMAATVLDAAPPAVVMPVAEGYPAWSGITPKNYILGRQIEPSDLRQKVTVVVDIEPNANLRDQLLASYWFVRKTEISLGLGAGANWETTPTLPRNVFVLFSVHDCKDPAVVKEALKRRKGDDEIAQMLAELGGNGSAYYRDATFEGAPDTAGKRPYFYVMGPEGKTPILQGALGKGPDRATMTAVNKASKELSERAWRPFYGFVEEPRFHPELAGLLQKGKPLAPVEKALVKDISSKDPERAKEAQILYDALNQTRSDLVFRIRMEAAACPHRAWYDLQVLLKHWPGEKKKLDAAAAKIKENPEAFKLAQMYGKVMVWDDPEFVCKNAGEAKKIVAALGKMKKDLEKLKESKVIAVQNGALLLDMKVDELIGLVPTKVPQK